MSYILPGGFFSSAVVVNIIMESLYWEWGFSSGGTRDRYINGGCLVLYLTIRKWGGSRIYSGYLLKVFSNLIRASCKNRKVESLFVDDPKGHF